MNNTDIEVNLKDSKKNNKRKFFASKAWYLAALSIIGLAILQEIIMASTDIVDNVFVNFMRDDQVKGLGYLNSEIIDSGWNLAGDLPGHLQEYANGKMKYSAGQIAVNGVASSNQMYIIMFSLVSGFCYGAGVFSAQYFGAGEYQKLKQVTAIKIYATFTITVIFALIAIDPTIFIRFTTQPHWAPKPEANVTQENAEQWFKYFQYRAATLSTEQGVKYYRIIAMSYLLLSINETMITSLRETRRPVYSFFMAVIALITNCVLNIFLTNPTFLGSFKGLGVAGCAIATASSRLLQFTFIISLLSIKKFEFTPGIRNFKVQKEVMKKVLPKSVPILVNEALYGFGIVVQVKLLALYSVEALTGNSMYETVVMALFSPLYHGINAGIVVLVGNKLGSNDFESAKYNARHLMILSLVMGIFFGALLASTAYFIPDILFSNANAEAKRIGFWMMFIFALSYPFMTLNNGAYSMLRSGGQVTSSFLMDSGFNWIIQMPMLAALIFMNRNGTIQVDIIYIHLAVCLCQIAKLTISLPLYFRRNWLQNLTVETKKSTKEKKKK